MPLASSPAMANYGKAILRRTQGHPPQLDAISDAGSTRHDVRQTGANGNATLAAARRFAQLVSTDYVPHLEMVARNMPLATT